MIAAIGGAISAYITKTFLDVHKVSLQQLNRYFAQPVINDHILMAQATRMLSRMIHRSKKHTKEL